MKHLIRFAVLLSLTLWVGCGGSDSSEPTVQKEAASEKKPSAETPATKPKQDSQAVATDQSSNSPESTDKAAGNKDKQAVNASLAKHSEALAILSDDDFALLRIDVAALRESKFLELFLKDRQTMLQHAESMQVMDGDLFAQLAFDVDYMVMSLGPMRTPSNPMTPEAGFTILTKFKSQGALMNYMATMHREVYRAVDYQGQTYHLLTLMPDAELVIYADGAKLYYTVGVDHVQKLIDGKLAGMQAPLVKQLGRANFDAPILLAGSLGPLQQQTSDGLQAMSEGMPVPPELAGLVTQLKWGEVALDPDSQTPIDIHAVMQSEESAEKLRTQVSGLLQLATILLNQQAGEAPADDLTAKGMAVGRALLGSVSVKREADTVELTLAHTPEFDTLPGLALQQAQATAKQVHQLNRARQISLVLINYRATHGKYPAYAGTIDLGEKKGKAPQSWRVAILPIMEQRGLWDRFDLDAAWDSEQNKQLIDQMPEQYQTEAATEPGTTTWKYLPELPGDIILVGGGKGTAVTWTEPDEFTFDPANPLAGLGEEPAGGYVVASSQGIVLTRSAEELKAILTGGELPSAPPGTMKRQPGPEFNALPTEVSGPVISIENTRDSEVISEPRTWKDPTGLFSVKAALIKIEGNWIFLQRTDNGEEISLLLNKLTEEDQKFAKEQVKKLEQPVVEEQPVKPRTWSDATGQFSIEATLIEVRDGKVILQRADSGEKVTLPIAKLSAADQKFVEELQE